MESIDPRAIGRRSFLGWMAKAAAGAAAFLGASVGYTPRALGLHNTPCLAGTKFRFTGTCTNPGLGPCRPPGGVSCVDVCNGNVQCIFNDTNVNARIKCTCHDKRCCLVAC